MSWGDVVLRLLETRPGDDTRWCPDYKFAIGERGHHYAAQAVRALLPFAMLHGFSEIFALCAQDNWASRRTLESAGFTSLGLTDIPPAFQGDGVPSQASRYRFTFPPRVTLG